MVPSKMTACIRILATLLILCLGFGCTKKPTAATYLRSGENFYQQQKYDEARIQFLNVLRYDRANATAVRRLGEIWFACGSPVSALYYLSTAQEMWPEDLGLKEKVASALAATGHRLEARKEALRILEKAPSNEDAIRILADTTRTAEEIEQTKKALAEAAASDNAAIHLANASLAVRNKGDLKTAEKEIQAALALEPKSVSAHLAEAEFLWLKNNLVGAGEQFKTAAGLDGPRSDGLMRMIDFKIANKANDEAKTLLKDASRATPDFLPVWTTSALLAIGEKKFDEGLDLLQNVFARDPENVNARMLQGLASLEKGDTEKAEQMLEELNQKERSLPAVKYHLARAYLANGKLGRAAEVLDEALAANQNFFEAVVLRATIRLRQGDAAGAVAALERVVSHRPDLPEPQLVLVEAYRSLSRLDEASGILEKQVATAPQNAALQLLMGMVQLQKNQPDQARASFERAFALEPENDLYLSELVGLDLVEGKNEAALQRVQERIAKGKPTPSRQFLLAKIYLSQKQQVEAEKALREALRLDPDFESASAMLANLCLAQRKTGEAEELFDKILERNPRSLEALGLSALLEENLGHLERARDRYESLLALAPSNEPMLNNLASLYLNRLHQPEKALELAGKALNLRPADFAAADTLGWALVQTGESSRALPLLQRSAEKLKDNPEVQYHLGTACYLTGDLAAAEAALAEAAAAPVDFPGKGEAVTRLALVKQLQAGEVPTGELEKLLAGNPDDLFLLQRLGETYVRDGAPTRAVPLFEKMTALSPKQALPFLKLAELNAGPLGKPEQALSLAEKAHELAPADTGVTINLGHILVQQQKFARAYPLLQQSARAGSLDAGVLYDLGVASYALGNLPEARGSLEKAATLEPASPAHAKASTLLDLLSLAEHPPAALENKAKIESTLREEPKNVPALMALATAQRKAGDATAAAATYERVLQQWPEFSVAEKGLAGLYADQPENRAKARELAARARSILPKDPELSAILAKLGYFQGEYAYTVQLLEPVARAGSADAQALFYLGMAQAKLKNPQAADWLGKALALGLETVEAAQARQTLDKLNAK